MTHVEMDVILISKVSSTSRRINAFVIVEIWFNLKKRSKELKNNLLDIFLKYLNRIQATNLRFELSDITGSIVPHVSGI